MLHLPDSQKRQLRYHSRVSAILTLASTISRKGEPEFRGKMGKRYNDREEWYYYLVTNMNKKKQWPRGWQYNLSSNFLSIFTYSDLGQKYSSSNWFSTVDAEIEFIWSRKLGKCSFATQRVIKRTLCLAAGGLRMKHKGTNSVSLSGTTWTGPPHP